jgi:UDP-N-acetylglucosamine--N-acetylmuramyl-(pentapeptide) pyrophosphoryl-undecaprenol N-acetylglucosamine transferase
VVTGNPVRREFFEIERKERDPARFSLLVFGGSQGARAINEALIAALPQLERHRDGLHIVHQTGEADFEKVRGGYEAAGWTERADVRQYIDDMVARFAESDLVICRAGATTTAELIAAGKASLMVPFPFAADDHQRRLVLQQDANGERLAREISELVENPDRVTRMEEAARKLARGDAAQAAVDLMEKLTGR